MGSPRSDPGCLDWYSGRSCTRPLPGGPAGAPGDAFSWSASWSESQIDGEEEAAARWERRYVDVSHDSLVTEVADLGIQAAIAGNPKQVTPTQAQPCMPHVPPEHALRKGGRQIVRHVQLTKLEVRCILHIGRGQSRRPVGEPLGTRFLIVRGVLTQVVQELGQVDDVAALLPVEQEADREAMDVEIARERHLKIRCRVTDFAFGPDDLGSGAVLLDLERSE